MHRARALLLCAAPALAPAQSKLWVVAQEGGADFAQIHAAVAAAAPGDTILVLEGTYEPFTLDKGLVITAEGGLLVQVPEGFTVTGLSASEEARVRGISVTAGGVVLAGNAGLGLPGPEFEGLGVGGTAAPMSAEPSMSLDVPSPLREGELMELVIHGPPGVPVFLGVGEGPMDLFAPSLSGAILVAPPFEVLDLGVTNSSGFVVADLPLPPLEPGLQVKHWFAQPAYVTPLEAIVLGRPSAVELLHPSF